MADSCCKQMTDYNSMELKKGHDKDCEDQMEYASCNDGEGCRPEGMKKNEFKTK